MPAGWIAVGVNFAGGGGSGAPILITSTAADASSWTDNSTAAATAYATVYLAAVCYSPTLDRWVAVGYDNVDASTPVVIYSNDGGNSWTAPGLPSFGLPGFQIKSVCWDGTKFIATGTDNTSIDHGKIMNSTDGISWTDRSTAGAAARNLWLNGISGLTAMVGSDAALSNGKVWTSTDHGDTWTGQVASQSNIPAINGVVLVSSGTHVAVGFPIADTNSGIATSTNGTTWTTITSSFPTNHSYYAVAWNGSIYAAVGSDFDTNLEGRASSSTNASTWTNRATDPPGPVNTFDGPNFLSVAALNLSGGGFTAVGRDNNSFTISYIMYSADALTWTARTSPIASGNGILNGVAAGVVAAGPVSQPSQPYGLLGLVDYET